MAKKQPIPAAPTVRGYKVTDAEMKCRGMQYELGKDYTTTGKPVRCGAHGLHFCRVANDCFNYYSFDPANRVFEVEAFGDLDEGNNKCATNGLRLLREIAWADVLNLINTGRGNTGRTNSGDRNSGDRNSGLFCTTTPKTIELFNRPSDWSYQDFLDSEACYLKNRVLPVEWRPWATMTDVEKEQYPRAETAEGYPKRHDYKEAHRTWWAQMDAREKACITELPNFDAAIFLEITGIALSA